MVTETEVRWLTEPGAVHEPSVLFEALRQRPRWVARAERPGEPLELFFLGCGADVRPAKAMWERCRVRRECADYALGSGSLAGETTSGICAGTSEIQRKRIRH